MPELPEVETVVRGLRDALVGKKLLKTLNTRSMLRYEFDKDFETIINNSIIKEVERRSKYILIRFENGKTLIVHLGMSGFFTIHHDIKTPINGNFDFIKKHDHVVFINDDLTPITYNDTRRFGFMIVIDTCDEKEEKHLKKLGPEPFDPIVDDDYIYNKLKSKKSSIKIALMDQSNVCGLGNIYVCETLWELKIDPRKCCCDIPREKFNNVTKVIHKILTKAIEKGGSSLKDFKNSDGALGYFQHEFNAYGRSGEDCNRPDCTGNIIITQQSGRVTFHCNTCQN